MKPSSDDRTALEAFVLDLLDFVDEKLNQAESDPGSRVQALAEAAGAVPIIKRRLDREDQKALAKLMLLGFFDLQFGQSKQLHDDEFATVLQEARNCLDSIRTVILVEKLPSAN